MTPALPMMDAGVSRWQRQALIVGGLGLLACVAGFFLVGKDQFFRSYLIGYLLWIGLALGSISAALIHNLAGGRWGMLIRRFLEAGSRTMVGMAVLFVPVILGIPSLYVWDHREIVAHDKLLQYKAVWLNAPFFIGRAVLYFLVWFVLMYLLNRWAPEREEPYFRARFKFYSGPGLIAFGFITTFAIMDWVLSLEPHFYSTMYSAIFMVGQVLSILSFSVIMLMLFSEREPFRAIAQPQYFQDLGNLMLAFTMLWAYTSFSQFLIIWQANLPDETPFYVRRMKNGWEWVAAALVLFHFAVPFLLLLQRPLKRKPIRLALIGAAMILMRFVDIVWQVEPNFSPNSLNFHWMDLTAMIGLGGVWVYLFLRELTRRPLLSHEALELAHEGSSHH